MIQSLSRQQIRQQKRTARRALPASAQRHAAINIRKTLFSHTPYLAAKRIALYLANDGEIDPIEIIRFCWQRNIEIYLPVLDPCRKGHLKFVRYQKASKMRSNRFGINEPDPRFNASIPTRFLNLVLLPLVAFDNEGNRLGMGGGFYDRTFEFCRRAGVKPTLVGLAHNCQQVEQLPFESWDIPLSKILSV